MFDRATASVTDGESPQRSARMGPYRAGGAGAEAHPHLDTLRELAWQLRKPELPRGRIRELVELLERAPESGEAERSWARLREVQEARGSKAWKGLLRMWSALGGRDTSPVVEREGRAAAPWAEASILERLDREKKVEK
jgi:hypothetical protein